MIVRSRGSDNSRTVSTDPCLHMPKFHLFSLASLWHSRGNSCNLRNSYFSHWYCACCVLLLATGYRLVTRRGCFSSSCANTQQCNSQQCNFYELHFFGAFAILEAWWMMLETHVNRNWKALRYFAVNPNQSLTSIEIRIVPNWVSESTSKVPSSGIIQSSWRISLSHHKV